jgi:hypothetical protein
MPDECCLKDFNAKGAKVAKTAKGTAFVDAVPGKSFRKIEQAKQLYASG